MFAERRWVGEKGPCQEVARKLAVLSHQKKGDLFYWFLAEIFNTKYLTDSGISHRFLSWFSFLHRFLQIRIFIHLWNINTGVEYREYHMLLRPQHGTRRLLWAVAMMMRTERRRRRQRCWSWSWDAASACPGWSCTSLVPKLWPALVIPALPPTVEHWEVALLKLMWFIPNG